MNLEAIAIAALFIALLWTNLRFSGKIMILEYKSLLMTEALATLEGSKDSEKVARQAREEINKKHWFLDKIAQR